jgi:hypothetical protein
LWLLICFGGGKEPSTLDRQVPGLSHNAGLLVRSEHQQVFVSGNQQVGVGALGAFEEDVVFGSRQRRTVP